MSRQAVTGSTPYIDAVDLWQSIKQEEPNVTAEEIARKRSATVEEYYKGFTITQTIFFDSTPCYFGNSRLWIRCPRCDIRVRVLYRPPSSNRFLCRLCHNMSYESCNRSRLQRQYPAARLWLTRLQRKHSDVIVI
jgi:hypothetical protein